MITLSKTPSIFIILNSICVVIIPTKNYNKEKPIGKKVQKSGKEILRWKALGTFKTIEEA